MHEEGIAFRDSWIEILGLVIFAEEAGQGKVRTIGERALDDLQGQKKDASDAFTYSSI